MIQTLLPLLRHFISGCLENICKPLRTDSRVIKYGYIFGVICVYIVFWIACSTGLFYAILRLTSTFVHILCVCVPYNPTEVAPVIVITLAVIQCILIFFEDFQSDYKILLDSLFNAIDRINSERPDDTKIRYVSQQYFDRSCREYILGCRKRVFLLSKIGFLFICVFVGYTAYIESGSYKSMNILSNFISATALVVLPEIVRRLLKPFGDAFEHNLESEILEDLQQENQNDLKEIIEGNMPNETLQQ